MALRLLNGNLLIRDGKLATSDDCCCEEIVGCEGDPVNVSFFNSIVISISISGDGTGAGCDMVFSFSDSVNWIRVDYDYLGGLTPPGYNFQLFRFDGIAFGGQDAECIYFATPSGGTNIGTETLTSTGGTCIGGDNVLIQVASTLIQPSVSGSFINCILSFFAQCRDEDHNVLCGVSDTFSGLLSFPNLWRLAPGSYTFDGINTPSGWTINYHVQVTFS